MTSSHTTDVALRRTALVALLALVAVAACAPVEPAPTTPVPTMASAAPATETAAASAATSSPPPTAPASPAASEAAGPLDADVAIGQGRTLHLRCDGAAAPGVPTVIFESGLGVELSFWDTVQRQVATRTRACAYDRAGAGASPAAPDHPRTASDLADDLDALLEAAALPGPYLFVSHSMGPWVTSLYAQRHPERVAGVVMVDPRGPAVSAAHLAALPPATPGEPEMVARFRELMTDPQLGWDANRESITFADSEAEARDALEAPGPLFGGAPVIVLSGTRTAADEYGGLPDELRAAFTEAWLAGQQAYADESVAGTLEPLPSVGHMIPSERPEIVSDAVLRMLDAVAP